MAIPRPLLPPLAVGAGWALAGSLATATTLLALFAATSALVAMQERRDRAAGLAAGIAVALAPAGLATLPVLLGVAIARGQPVRMLGAMAGGLLAMPAIGGWMPMTSDASLWTVAPAESAGLLAALACGTVGWIAAACSARPPSPRELDEAALLAALALPLLAPIGIEAAGLGIALALTGVRLSLAPVAMGANDNPLPLRRITAG